MGSGNINDNLTAAFIDHTAVIRVEGKGSFKVSPPMKQFIHKVIDDRSADRILVDMAACTGMDSTFMGVVAGAACMMRSRPSVRFKLINLSERNRKLLVTLGVDRVVEYSLQPNSGGAEVVAGKTSSEQILEPDFSDKLEAAKTALEAHSTLVDINPDNYDKFKSVLDYLQDDVRNLGGN